MDGTKIEQSLTSLKKRIISPIKWEKEKIGNKPIPSYVNKDNKICIWFTDYFYVPVEHVGLVYKNGVFQRYLFTGLHKVKNPQESIRIEGTSYNQIERAIDITYCDGSTYRIYESIEYRVSKDGIHSKLANTKNAMQLIGPLLYPLVRKYYATLEPEDSTGRINDKIMVLIRKELAKSGIWLMSFYPKCRRKIKYIRYTGDEYTNKAQNLHREIEENGKEELTMNTNDFEELNDFQEPEESMNSNWENKNKNDKKIVKLAACVIGGLFGLSLVMGCFSVIETGERGVVLRLGEYKYTMNEGLNFKAPLIDSVYKLQVRDRSYNSDVEVSSKDMQTIKISSALVYSLDESKVGDIYRRYGNNIETTIIKPTVAEVINSTIAQYPIEEFVNKRDEISQKIMGSLKVRLADIGIDIKSFLITNHDFSDDYNKAIEQKKIAEQAAITAEYNKQKAQLDSEANKYRQEGLSKYVLMEKFLDKWDGHMPKVLTGSDSNMSMILNTDDLK